MILNLKSSNKIIHFRYKTRITKDIHEANLFFPKGEAIQLSRKKNLVKIVEGPIISFVTVSLPLVDHTVKLYHPPSVINGLGIEIDNVVDASRTTNYEVIMRLKTNIQNKEDFFTDSNGYQVNCIHSFYEFQSTLCLFLI